LAIEFRALRRVVVSVLLPENFRSTFVGGFAMKLRGLKAGARQKLNRKKL